MADHGYVFVKDKSCKHEWGTIYPSEGLSWSGCEKCYTPAPDRNDFIRAVSDIIKNTPG